MVAFLDPNQSFDIDSIRFQIGSIDIDCDTRIIDLGIVINSPE